MFKRRVPHEKLEDEYTARGYKARAREIKMQERKKKAKKIAKGAAAKITGTFGAFTVGVMKGAGIKLPKKKPTAEQLGMIVGKQIKKHAKKKITKAKARTKRRRRRKKETIWGF
jgi:hypothetical protein